MTYPQIILGILQPYLALCLLAWIFSWRQKEMARLQPLLYGLIVGLWGLVSTGHASHFHFWWYLINAAVDIGITLVALAFYTSQRLPSSKWVATFGCAMVGLDLVYFVMASPLIGHRLPGIIYFAGTNALESLQVGALVLFSGPVVPALLRAWRYATQRRTLPWTHHRQSVGARASPHLSS